MTDAVSAPEKHLADEQLAEYIFTHGPAYEVAAALTGNNNEADITYYSPNYLLGSSLFNTVTAAMNQLRIQPDKQLISEKIAPPDRCSMLSRYLLGILNASIDRHRAPTEDLTFESDKADRVFYCLQAEDYFMRAIRNPTIGCRLYTDRNHSPAIFKKGGEYGEQSALTLRPLTINGIDYPAGTIISAKDDPSQLNLLPHRKPAIYPATPAQFTHMAAVRFSAFALPQEERAETLRFKKGNLVPDETIEDLAHELTEYCMPSTE